MDTELYEQMRGGTDMGCEHRRIISTNCVVKCLDCGAVLSADFLTVQTAQKQAVQAENAQEGVKVPAEREAQETGKKPGKRRAKKGE